MKRSSMTTSTPTVSVPVGPATVTETGYEPSAGKRTSARQPDGDTEIASGAVNAYEDALVDAQRRDARSSDRDRRDRGRSGFARRSCPKPRRSGGRATTRKAALVAAVPPPGGSPGSTGPGPGVGSSMGTHAGSSGGQSRIAAAGSAVPAAMMPVAANTKTTNAAKSRADARTVPSRPHDPLPAFVVPVAGCTGRIVAWFSIE